MEYRPKYYPREYTSYSGAKHRCNASTCPGFNNYGGRGIKFSFKSFEEFMNHIGVIPKDKKYSLDRINVNGNYEIGNVRWADRLQQARNTRANTIFTIDGIAKPLSELADIYDKPYKSVHRRIYRYGWTIEKSLKSPMRGSGRHNKCGIKYLYKGKNRWIIDRRINGERIIIKLITKKDAIFKLKELGWIK